MHRKFTACLLRMAANAGFGLLLANHAAFADAPKPDVSHFFSGDSVSEVSLSPDGKYVAIVSHTLSPRRYLQVMDIESKKAQVVAGFSNTDVENVHWVNNDRLVFSTYETEYTYGERRYYPGLVSVKRDGTDMRTLVTRNPEERSSLTHLTVKILTGRTFFYDVDRSGTTDDIFVIQPVDKPYTEWDIKAYRLLKLNTQTGRFQTIERPGDTTYWMMDQNGAPRLNVTQHEGVEEIFYLDPANDKWRKIADFPAYGEGIKFAPKYFGPDGTLYVTARNGQDTSALYRFDLTKNEIDPVPVIAVKGYDFDVVNEENAHFDDQFIVSGATKKLLGVNYQTDASATLWFDDGMKKIQKAVDDLLPNTANMLSIGRSGDTRNVLVHAFSDVQPGKYLIYDSVSGALTPIGKVHPSIDPQQMSHQDMVHYKARDGMDIPAYLTLPRGANPKNLPMVVLVHGGPQVRGASWGWDGEVQFLASRGYAVLQPEFRGSMGFGFKHFQAGWKQWGQAMQDDVADGTKWAIAQGYADPKRICIAGASYGGYATLMGLAKNPELFRCGFEWVGVTDINLMFEDTWKNDAPEEWRHYGMPVMIGDPVKDAEMIKANSPVNIPNRITQPLLMAYGGLDHRVPLEHGEKFRDAIKPFNSHVEWVVYPEEGHGWQMLKDDVDFWTRVEKFLDANIGKAAPAQGVATN